jgi:6-pyruvoyltetrahydropterin/6-carboxytetrahydropterin synthase
MIYKITSSFSAAHFYTRKDWSAEKNLAVFGKCSDPHGHGHDYKLVVSFKTENYQDYKELSHLVKQTTDVLDHHHMNFALEEFKTKIPTTENIAVYCFEKIQALNSKIISLKLYETEDLWVEYG